MGEFLRNAYKLFGATSCGFFAIIYSLYLKITKKIPYSIEISLKPESKEKYIQMEFVSLLIYSVIMISLTLLLTFTNFDKSILIIIHVILIVIVFFYKHSIVKDMYK